MRNYSTLINFFIHPKHKKIIALDAGHHDTAQPPPAAAAHGHPPTGHQSHRRQRQPLVPAAADAQGPVAARAVGHRGPRQQQGHPVRPGGEGDRVDARVAGETAQGGGGAAEPQKSKGERGRWRRSYVSQVVYILLIKGLFQRVVCVRYAN